MNYYTIKEVSEKTKISTYTLRYYEREGLIPFVHRLGNSHRLYSEENLEWLQLVSCMRATNMSISDIKSYIDMSLLGEDTIPERHEMILNQKKIIEAHIKEYKGYLKIINKKFKRYEEMQKAKKSISSTPDAK